MDVKALGQFHFTYRELSFPSDFGPRELRLFDAARAAAESAYAPYSGFPVGCALEMEDGALVSASNQENAAYPSGLCAERVALFFAGARWPGLAVKALFIFIPQAESVLAPCGACRQVISESLRRQESPMALYFPSGFQRWIFLEDASLLLPFAFTLKPPLNPR
ncbi:MAG: cytidine deaminase [Flavobacteriales bacterium]|nr:cytidine deaminase [Flavobacteriales bacterium]MDW8431159.1 cytidine deaminase [Flavobacteriales bacterium]